MPKGKLAEWVKDAKEGDCLVINVNYLGKETGVASGAATTATKRVLKVQKAAYSTGKQNVIFVPKGKVADACGTKAPKDTGVTVWAGFNSALVGKMIAVALMTQVLAPTPVSAPEVVASEETSRIVHL
jgi:hypothetical protein